MLSKTFLKIKKSKLPKAGKGVFTNVDIKKGQVITDLTGPLIKYKEYLKLDLTRQHYCFYINRNNIIDTYFETDQIGRYVNDAHGTKDGEVKNNSEFIVEKGDEYSVYIVATVDIAKGTEILVDYGDSYWDL